MGITTKGLSIYPYISVSWKEVVSLQIETRLYGHCLMVELSTGSKIEIPNLEKDVLKQIFSAHEQHLSGEDSKVEVNLFNNLQPLISSLQGFLPIIQHNAEQANTPEYPKEMLEKIGSLFKNQVPVEELNALPKPEPHCNCPYCQIARVILAKESEPTPDQGLEEPVHDEDLRFRSWDIQQKGEKLYTVTNPLDIKEHYHVFLGEPLGCTCGNKNCEHIQAVLKT